MRRKTLYLMLLAVASLAATGAFLTMSQAGGLTGIQWTQIGPQPLEIDAESNFQGTGPDSGQTVDVAIDPRGSTDQIIYIATQDGGIWQSTDGGNTWRTTTDFLSSLSMGAVALDPSNPSIVYAGTGSPANTGFFKFVGVYKSTDLGTTWTLTPGMNGFSNIAIRRIVMPAANQLLLATNLGVIRSTNGMTTVTRPLVNGSNTNTITDLHLDTANPSNVFAAVNGAGIFESTDGGATWGSNLWTASNGSPLGVANFTAGFISFAQSTKPDNKTIYASVQNTSNTAAAPFWGLFVSTDTGATWAQASANNNPSNNCGQCGYDQTIGVEPNDAATVYLGFVDMWKSTDSGANFSEIGHGQVHNDHHALVFSPHVPASGNTTFYDGQDGGIALSSDGGSTFVNINGPNPGVGTAIASNLLRNMDIGRGSATANKYTYGGMQDTGTGSFTSSDTPNTWHLHVDGDGAGVAVDPYNPQHAVGMDDACLMNTTDGGSSWSFASVSGNTGGQGFGFGNTLAFDQVNTGGTDNTVYASVTQWANPPKPGQGCFGQGATTFAIYRSTDGGGSYASLFQGLSAPANAIATSKIDPNTVWFALNDGNLQVSTNMTAASPTIGSPATQPPQAGKQPATAIAIDPANTQTVVVTYAGFCGAACGNGPTRHVYETTDGGSTWTDISGTAGGSSNLPDLPVHAVVIDQTTNPHAIIVANDAGVLQSGDNGATWQVLGFGMPTVDVVALALDTSASPELLRAGTFGRSTFELGPATGPLISINTATNFGTLCSGQSPTTLLQVFNLGASPLMISNISRVSGSTDFTVTGPSFPATIQPGEEVDWTIQVNITNSSTNPDTATFEIDSNDQFQPALQVTYTASIGQPSIGTAIADSGSFGNVCAGNLEDLNLTVTNGGSCNLDLTGLTFSPPDADFVAPTFTNPTVVGAGSSVAIPIRYQPQNNTAGVETTTIELTSNAAGSPTMIPVSGNAPPGQIAVSGSGTFGNVCAGSNAQQTITVANTGPCNLHVTSATIDNGSGGACPDFTIENNPFPNTLSQDSSLPLTVAFTPTSGGTKTCRLVITSDDPINPTVTVALTATTPAVNIDVPAQQNFPATVIQSVGACTTPLAFPVSNNGSCPLTITNVAISGPNAADYSLSGLPSLSTPLPPGEVLGNGDLATVFAPTLITRNEQATVTVTYESDPITHATATATENMCGEGTSRGVRVLVTEGGTPLPTGKVTKLQLSRLTSNRKSISVSNVNDPPLRSVNQAAPCASFMFHYEWGGVTNPIQLTAGDYQLTVSAIVNGKKKSQTVSFTLGTCSFNQNLVVNF